MPNAPVINYEVRVPFELTPVWRNRMNRRLMLRLATVLMFLVISVPSPAAVADENNSLILPDSAWYMKRSHGRALLIRFRYRLVNPSGDPFDRLEADVKVYRQMVDPQDSMRYVYGDLRELTFQRVRALEDPDPNNRPLLRIPFVGQSDSGNWAIVGFLERHANSEPRLRLSVARCQRPAPGDALARTPDEKYGDCPEYPDDDTLDETDEDGTPDYPDHYQPSYLSED